MSVEKLLMGASEADVRAAMAEECAMDCFGCPSATISAAQIVKFSTLSQVAVELMARDKWFVQPMEDEIARHETIQREAREELANLTVGCVGWHDGVGGKEVPRPEMMCNSPSNPDFKISVAAGWLLERIPFISRFR